MYNKTLQNLSFYDYFSMEHFPQYPQKGVCNEIFPTKETCPPPLKFCILFYKFYMKGGLILHVFQYVFQNHVKSRKIYM